MNITRWDPFRSFDEALRGFPGLFGHWPRLTESNGTAQLDWSPSVDISETDMEYLLRAELPSVKKEDVRVTFDDGMLTISGERRQKKEDKGEKLHRIESFYGKFARSFSLPDNIDNAAIRAESKDGVLTVHVPKIKTEAKKATEIKVQ